MDTGERMGGRTLYNWNSTIDFVTEYLMVNKAKSFKETLEDNCALFLIKEKKIKIDVLYESQK